MWLPNWPVQRVQAAEPRLAEQPLLLTARDARRGVVIQAANIAARQAHVHPGMRLSEALVMVTAEVREHDSHEDIETLCELAEQAQQFSPLVGLEQLERKLWAGRTLLQPECLLLDITGLAHLFGGEVALLQGMRQWLRAQNYFGYFGIADSIGAAWALANYGTRQRGYSLLEEHTVAKPADANATSDTEGAEQAEKITLVERKEQSDAPSLPESRYRIAAAGDSSSALHALPLPALRIEPATLYSLRRLGVKRIGELAAFPRDGIATRLGNQLLIRWDQATGAQTETLVALHSSPDWALEHVLEYPTDNRETVAEIVRRLCHELCSRLQRRGEGALRMTCRLDLQAALGEEVTYSGNPTPSPPGSAALILQIGLFRPTSDHAHLQMLIDGQLEQMFKQSSVRPLWRVGLQATLTAPLVWRQSDLFHAGEVDHRQQIARLVDTLSSRLGRKNVLSAKVQRDVQPESAYVLQPLTGVRKDGQPQMTVRKLSTRLASRRAEPSPEEAQRRPSHLLAQPVPIDVAGRWQPADAEREPEFTFRAEVEETRPLAAAPARIKYQGGWFGVVEACGPERLESGWWKGPSDRRDYYRIVNDRGSWWWIYRDLNNNQWFLHGLFD